MKIWDQVFAQVAVTPLDIVQDRSWREIEYASGLVASESCAEVVKVPLPDDAVLQAKEGCGINLRNLTERLRRNIGSWFN